MTKFDYFSDEKPQPYRRAKLWEGYQGAEGYHHTVANLTSEWDGLVRGKPELELVFETEAGRPVGHDRVDWEVAVEPWLESKGILTSDERLRFMLRIKARLSEVVDRYGDGYFNSVLTEILREDLGDEPQVIETLAKVHANKPYEGRSHSECQHDIRSALQSEARAAVSVQNSKEVGRKVFVDAIVEYLADRFHLRAADALGW